jgi:hypothetical protein
MYNAFALFMIFINRRGYRKSILKIKVIYSTLAKIIDFNSKIPTNPDYSGWMPQ